MTISSSTSTSDLIQCLSNTVSTYHEVRTTISYIGSKHVIDRWFFNRLHRWIANDIRLVARKWSRSRSNIITTGWRWAGPVKLVVPADIDRVPRVVRLSCESEISGWMCANLSTAWHVHDPDIYLRESDDHRCPSLSRSNSHEPILAAGKSAYIS